MADDPKDPKAKNSKTPKLGTAAIRGDIPFLQAMAEALEASDQPEADSEWLTEKIYRNQETMSLLGSSTLTTTSDSPSTSPSKDSREEKLKRHRWNRLLGRPLASDSSTEPEPEKPESSS